MPIIVQCPTCERKLRVPDQLLGKKVKCPGCQGTFTAGDKAPAKPETPAGSSPQPVPSGEKGKGDGTGPKVEMDPNLQLELDEPAPRASPKGKKSEEIAETPSRSGRARDEDEPDDDKIRCPHCGERIRASSIRCKYCGEEIGDEEEDEEDDRPSRRKKKKKKKRRRSDYGDLAPHRGGMVMTLGIISGVCGLVSMFFTCCCPFVSLGTTVAGVACGIPAWIMGQKDLAKMRDGIMDDAGKGNTQTGWIFAMVGTILSGVFVVLTILRFIIWGAAVSSGFGGGGFSPPNRNFSVDRHPIRLESYFPSRGLVVPAVGE
jgi:hypothetical protein